jgi:hypothetical protein
MELGFCQHIFEEKSKYQILSKSVHWESSCFMLTDGQTDTTKLRVAFCVALTTHLNLAPRWKKEWSYASTASVGFHGLF